MNGRCFYRGMIAIVSIVTFNLRQLRECKVKSETKFAKKTAMNKEQPPGYNLLGDGVEVISAAPLESTGKCSSSRPPGAGLAEAAFNQ